MYNILAYTITRANSPSRAKLLLATITQARDTAESGFEWEVHCPEGSLADDICKNALDVGLINNVVRHSVNVGQHVCTNEVLDKCSTYDYLLRLDDDVEFKTKQWLRKLVEASVALEDKMILSPVVRGLLNPPPRSDIREINGISLEFLMEAIGGICRLHPVKVLLTADEPYVSDVRLPMGSGDASGIASWARRNTVPMAYVRSINVRHALGTKAQMDADVGYAAEHDIFQHIPYIPAWGG